MRAWVVSYAFVHAVVLGACAFRPSAGAGAGDMGTGSALPDAPLIDASSDAAVDAPVAIDAPHIDASLLGTCYGTAPTQICLLAPPTVALSLSNPGTVNTDMSPECQPAANVTQPDDGSLCVIAATQVMISGAVSASGSRPLVVISLGDISVNGTIDVGSHLGRQRGAAADPAACGAPPDGNGQRGGGGGTFGGVGGAGGGGVGSGSATPVTPTTLRGGCAGGSVSQGGTGGAGGGALALIAVGTITVNGQIDASGAAGGGSTQIRDRGGGGGGAGGMIVLDAGQLAGGGGAIFAAGGGGGEASSAYAGNDGGEAAANNLMTGAPGGSGGTQIGGDGGNGSTSTTASGAAGGDGSSGAGGGGGGGGAGVIVIHVGANTFGGTRSPGS